MIVLIVMGAVIYLAIGIAIARMLTWRFDLLDADGPDGALVCIFWAVVLPFAIVAAAGYGLHRLTVMPPLRVRRERRHARLLTEIRHLERELGMQPDRWNEGGAVR